MNETSQLINKRQTINPMIDDINRQTEPLLKKAMQEFGFEIPLTFRLYNQIRFYELSGKLKSGFCIASKETLADQFGVSVKQINEAFSNLTSKYKLGKWINHDESIFRNVKRTWVSNERLKLGFENSYSVRLNDKNSYSVRPKLIQRMSKTHTAYELPPQERPLSESKKKVSESKYYNNNNKLLLLLNSKTNRNFRTLPNGYKTTLKKFTLEEIEIALTNLANDDWHKEKLGELKSDYLLRASTIDNFLNRKSKKQLEISNEKLKEIGVI